MQDSPDRQPGRPRAASPEAAYRRRRLAGLILVLGLLVAVIDLNQWIQHGRLRARLTGELADRLLGLAKVSALSVDGEMLRRWQAWGIDLDEEDRLRARLEGAVDANAVLNVTVLDLEGRVVLDVSGLLSGGEPDPAIALDRAAFTAAAAGIAQASMLRNLDGQYLMAAYAPVESDEGEVAAVLAVEGAADLFEVLDDLRGTMVAVAIGSVLGIVLLGLVLVRISDSLARAERELLRAETLTSMGRMAAGIAHEIRNPLGIIRATAERLRRRVPAADPHLGPAVDSIVEEVDRLNGIVSGYLNFASERPSEMVVLDLVPLVRRTLALAASDLDGIELVSELATPAAPVCGDAARLRQVLLNLLLNARQAMPDGGRLQVAVTPEPAAAAPARYRLVVADTGVGIAHRQLEQIWKPFFTSKPEGSGLGLSIVRRIIGEHRGTIRIASTVGRGTTVTIELPAAPPAPAAGRNGA